MEFARAWTPRYTVLRGQEKSHAEKKSHTIITSLAGISIPDLCHSCNKRAITQFKSLAIIHRDMHQCAFQRCCQSYNDLQRVSGNINDVDENWHEKQGTSLKESPETCHARVDVWVDFLHYSCQICFQYQLKKYCFQLLTMPLVISDLYVTLSLDGATSILVQDRVSASEI